MPDTGAHIPNSAAAPDRIAALLTAEFAACKDVPSQRTRADFEKLQCRPHEITVNFSGGLTQSCWRVTRSDGDYSIVYMPRADYFALCVDSAFGPLDIGVHGPALGCFGSV